MEPNQLPNLVPEQLQEGDTPSTTTLQVSGSTSDLDPSVSEPLLVVERIPLLSEMKQELQGVLRRREWELQEGLVTILAIGISELSAQDRQNAPVSTELAGKSGQVALDPVTQELAYYHAMYSTMKFRAFSLTNKLKVLELREHALRAKVELGGKWAYQARSQIEKLSIENTQLRQRIRELDPSGVVDMSGSSVESEPRENIQNEPAHDESRHGLMGRVQDFLSR